jgi:hypothetical protein
MARLQWLRRGGVRRSGWVMASQGVSSLSTLLATVVVARSVDTVSFGRFSLAFVTFFMVQALGRAFVQQPLAIRFGAQGASASAAEAVGAAAGASVTIGALATVVLAPCALVVGGEFGSVLLVVAVCLPVLLLQDSYRFACFVAAQPRRAAASDGVWLVGQALFTGLVLAGTPTVATLTAAWAGGGCLAAAWAARRIGLRPLGHGLTFAVQHRDLGWRFAGELVVLRGTSYLVVLVIAPIVGVAAIGAIRGGTTLFGPFTTVLFGITSAALSEGSRVAARHPDRFVPTLRLLGVGLGALAAGWGLALMVMPSAWGRALLGDTWSSTHDLLPLMTIGQTAIGVACGAMMGLRVSARADEILRLRVMVAASALGLALFGAQWGAAGALAGTASSQWLLAAGAWRTLGRPARPSRARVEARPPIGVETTS